MLAGMRNPTPALPTVVVAAVRHVLRPLVRLMIWHGITLPAIVELLKQVLVDVAEKDLPVEGKRTTDSRVSVLTGVHRKDVKRLRDTGFEPSDVPKSVSLGMQLVNVWLTDPRWQDEQGEPMALPRSSEDPQQPNFEQLADSVSKDVRARAILDELLRSGVVRVLEDGRVSLISQAYIPSEGVDQKLYYFEQSAYAHLMAGVQNLEGVRPPYFDRVVKYHSIPASALPALQELLEEKGMAFLKEANLRAKRRSREDAEDPHQVAIGLYFYHEPAERD